MVIFSIAMLLCVSTRWYPLLTHVHRHLVPMDPKSFGKIHMVSYHMVVKLVVAPPLPIFARKIMQKSHVDGSKPMKLPNSGNQHPFPSHSPGFLGTREGFDSAFHRDLFPGGPNDPLHQRYPRWHASRRAGGDRLWSEEIKKRSHSEPILATKMLIFSRKCGEKNQQWWYFLWQGW